ncbi:MAG: type II secretion system protein [Oliverpabstia sp.]|nr:type II secretion system protein [Oliverpabstia sp.]
MHIKRSKKGFTLAELLIVVAIIGVLVAISIPIFSGQLEKAREATDAANIRSQYAEVLTDAICDGGSVNGQTAYGAVKLRQQNNGWQTSGTEKSLHSVFSEVIGSPVAGGMAWVEYDGNNDKTILHYDGSDSTGGSGGSTTGGSTAGSNGGSTTGDNISTGSGGSTGTDTTASGDDKILKACANKTWTLLDVSSDSEATQTTTLQRGDLFTYKHKLYVAVAGKSYTENKWYKDNPDNANNARNLVCIDNSQIISKADEKDVPGWNARKIYMKYGDIYKTEAGVYYFYNGDPCYQDCPEGSNYSDPWVKLNI